MQDYDICTLTKIEQLGSRIAKASKCKVLNGVCKKVNIFSEFNFISIWTQFCLAVLQLNTVHIYDTHKNKYHRFKSSPVLRH